jgi:hypothetical protein
MTEPITTDVPTTGAEGENTDTATTDAGTTFSQADIDRIVGDRLRKEQAKFGDYGDLKRKAAEFDKHAEAQKTETQKLSDRLAASEKAMQEKDTALARMSAAATYSIPPDLTDMLGSGTPEEIDARAKLLAEKLKPGNTPAASTPAFGRPVESLKPGAAPGNSAQKDDPDTWLRRAAGRR